MTRIVVANSLEGIQERTSALRNQIDADCVKKVAHIVDPQARQVAYLNEFRNHEMYPKYKDFITQTRDVIAKTNDSIPIHNIEWHTKSKEKWENIVKEITELLGNTDKHQRHIPAREFSEKKRLYAAVKKHAHEEIKYHEKMIKLMGPK